MIPIYSITVRLLLEGINIVQDVHAGYHAILSLPTFFFDVLNIYFASYKTLRQEMK